MLKVIEGGKGLLRAENCIFKNAYVTDTRLMGVVGMHICWDAEFDGERKLWHQFYYYDVEETGLETVKFYIEGDGVNAMAIGLGMFGGLGASYVEITEKEARFQACRFVNRTKAMDQPLPKEISSLDFILNDPPDMSAEEVSALDAKMCVGLHSDYAVVNYYIMRCIGHDFEAADFLKDPGMPETEFQTIHLPKQGTFFRNKITQKEGRLGFKNYYCEALVESGNQHYMISCELEVVRHKVTRVEKGSCFPISLTEASMLLAKPEYVNVYNIMDGEDGPAEFDMAFAGYTLGTTCSNHENGMLFMEFKPDNGHVERHLFRLSDDISCIYFETTSGQLLLLAYSFDDIHDAELRLMRSPLANNLELDSRYKFNDSVLLDFADGDFDDFNEFVRNLTEE